MSKASKITWGVIAGLLVGLVWALTPVYLFFSHQKGWPMPPWGFVAMPENAPTTSHSVAPRYRAVADEALAHLNDHRKEIHAPGISAAVAVGGRLVWAGAAGWADIEQLREVTPYTQFRIGSTSKPVTATAAARLVQEEQLRLDQPLKQYPLALPNSQWGELTVRDLASHTSGLPEYKENRDWMGLYHTMALRKRYESVQKSLLVFDGTELLYPPGEQFHYTTFNTVLLSAVMEAAAGVPYRRVMNDRVFDPLNMTMTRPEPSSPIKTMATFYWREGERLRPWRTVDLSHRLAGGGFISTPTDLVKLGSAWPDEDYLSPSVRSLFWEPQRLANGDVNEQNYALGWRIHQADDYMAMNANHGGVSRGAQSWLMVIPEYQMSVAVMINSRTEAFWDFGKVAVVLAHLFQNPDP
ncbi:serine hydrolase domain-containing protein [Marinimicrobium locisalis]|uniref:serine hydrolase domain-containing protein n=1 Tax=Marinimicrobium locisalis TaxID=546022 RepID=UPI003221EAEC